MALSFLVQAFISRELCSLREAAYCYEELLLSEPENFRFYTSVAEIYYTLGGKDNFLLARKYYSHSLLLNKDQNLRSLYGLHAVG